MQDVAAPHTRRSHNLLVKYILWHMTLVQRIYGMIILKFNPSLFCFFFNLAAVLRNIDVRFSYDKNLKRYTAASSQQKLYFYHRKQAEMAYRDGFSARANSLGHAYFLPEISFKAGDLVVDCGANMGDLKLYFSENAIPVEYLGFEPSPLEFECLKQNVSPSVVLNKGLWNADSFLTFYVSSQGADSSFIKPPSFDEECKIPTTRLDSIVQKKIKLLKLEAEGAEPEVLVGCENIFKNIEYISADLGFERGVEQKSTLAPVVNYLLAKNFELLGVRHDRIAALFRNKNYERL